MTESVIDGLTEEEKKKLTDISNDWIAIAMRTDPIEPDMIVPTIEGLYAAVGLKKPLVVIVPSPGVMALAYGASASIWQTYNNTPIDAEVCDITYWQTHGAAIKAANDNNVYSKLFHQAHKVPLSRIHNATFWPSFASIQDAIFDVTHRKFPVPILGAVIDVIHKIIPEKVVIDDHIQHLIAAHATQWTDAFQAGNMWAYEESYICEARDVFGLTTREIEGYNYWEIAARHGSFRVMHPEFCIVSDFPEILRVDDQNLPHCEHGPSHRWRDGWSLYHWHGIRVPAHWIENRDSLDPAEVIRADNVEQRAAGAAIIGWPRMVSILDRKIIDGNPDTDIGALIELTLPGLPEPGRFLQAVCPRNGTIVEGVPHISDIDNLPIDTVIAAQAWRDGIPSSEYQHPLIRT